MHQGVVVHNQYVEDEKFKAEKAIPNVINVNDHESQIRDIDFLRHLNEMHIKNVQAQDSDLDASIKAMETAFRMQTEAPGRVRRQQRE